MSGCKPRLLLPGHFVSLNYLLELQGSKGAMPRQGRGAGGLFVGSVIQPAAGSTASLDRRMPKQCRGSQSERELGEVTLLLRLLKRGCKAWGVLGLCPPAQGGVFGCWALLAAPPAAGATVTSGASPCPAAEDSPAAMRLLVRRSRQSPPRFGPSASGGGGVRLGRCCWGGDGGAGHGDGVACCRVRVCVHERTCACMREHA